VCESHKSTLRKLIKLIGNERNSYYNIIMCIDMCVFVFLTFIAIQQSYDVRIASSHDLNVPAQARLILDQKLNICMYMCMKVYVQFYKYICIFFCMCAYEY